MPKNSFNINILEDGALSINTDDFSPEVHKQADEFIKYLGELMGGEVVVKEKHTHSKQHQHSHDHGKTFHTH